MKKLNPRTARPRKAPSASAKTPTSIMPNSADE